MEIFFNEQIQQIIIDAINSAKYEIHCAIYRFNDENIFNALKSASQKSVKIYMLISESEENIDYTSLIGKGLEIYPINCNLLHHKFLIIDRKDLITGSYNWTYAANSKNFENAILLKGNSEICNKYIAEFNNIQQKNSVNFLPKVSLTNTSNSIIPPSIGYIKWWRNLGAYWQLFFNNKILQRGLVFNDPTNWEEIFSRKTITIDKDDIYKDTISKYEFKSLEGLSELYNIVDLRVYYISNGNSILNLKHLSKMKHLEKLTLVDCNLRTITGITDIENLVEITIYDNPLLDSLKGIETLPYLTKIICDTKFLSYNVEQTILTNAGFVLDLTEMKRFKTYGHNIAVYKRN